MSDKGLAIMVSAEPEYGTGGDSAAKELIAQALEKMFAALKSGDSKKAAEYFCAAVSLEKEGY